MNSLMIPLSLGGGPKENRQVLEYPGASIHPDVCFATLDKPLINNLTSVMDITHPIHVY